MQQVCRETRSTTYGAVGDSFQSKENQIFHQGNDVTSRLA